MIDHTRTKYVWIVDGDEVYPDSAMPIIRRFVENWPADINCVFYPVLWVGPKIANVVTAADPGFGPYTGRLFRRNGFTIRGEYPNELACFGDKCVNSWLDHRWRRDVAVMTDAVPYHHMQMVVKPWRRKVLKSERRLSQQPQQMIRDGLYEGEGY
jgi:hypothetical protein